ncbi:phage major tail tube protein [Hafnia alvei]|uniref:phage major tail tube protein n=1 Tax=Hafnia alvei TaxID=569 RepID=UPI0021632BEA|nr:phage major tail tube protein [Hafnia alvei]
MRAWSFFAKGQRIQGAHEYTPPELSIQVANLRSGAQDAPTPVDDGMEALTCQVKFWGIDTDVLALLGCVVGQKPRFTAYEGYMSNGTALGTIEEFEGFVSKVTRDARSGESLSEVSVTVDLALNYYKQTLEGRELIEIDTERFTRRIKRCRSVGGLAAKIRL